MKKLKGEKVVLNNIKHIILAIVAVTLSNWLPLQSLADDNRSRSFNYSDYTLVLKTYVNQQGMVDYEKLKDNPARLDSFMSSLAKLHPDNYDDWSEKEKIAFWLNTYNALTLKAIIDSYPIKSSFFKSLYYPKNSIRQIDGVWDRITFDVLGQKLTLGHIEHKILREKFNEPRIHMAMVCAAKGCPYLRTEPYTGEKLDLQLDDQTRRFLSDTDKFKINRTRKKVYFSPIFDWFGADFIKKYAPPNKASNQGKEQSAVINFIAAYVDKAAGDYLRSGKFEIKYLKYDWTLNEQ